ncbi:type VI secretion system baseplate subunit TssG [Psychrosphaera aquimarina]|uniref:Type VI secretion system baseplate subunit TssG n=1 Tax=Psychrosphaera aquimarina TaxID=2044854 RepID=A0ABU3QW72_9GAMM|nr:type VI secretion system baseplate subunit TssG [Psychrosphaera aquimarina]MDU0111679.1 type VI secretion system baseplate subunit TssG [Psychrosphaera aquimarina]
MASQDRQQTASIEQDILRDGSAYTFNKLITLLHSIVIDKGQDPSMMIRIRPELSMSLNRSQIVSVTKTEDGVFDVITNFMGLYGASSPLPNFYTDELIELEQEDQTSARTFLDVIHQRLYQLYGEAQNKYNIITSVVEQQQSIFSQLLHTFTGSRDSQLQQAHPDANQLISYLGLLSSSQRSAEGLQVLLEGFLNNISVIVEQCVERSVSIPTKHQSSLGNNACLLGENALLGNKLTDRKSKIIIHLGPLSQDQFDKLVNDKTQWNMMLQLIKTYLNTPLEVDIKIALIARAAQGVALGDTKWCQLGYDTWLLDNKPLDIANPDSDILYSTLRLQ